TVRGILVDLPRTVARSEEIFQAAGVVERVTTVGQSFFEALPAGADLYVLKGVLNDWPNPEAMAILKRCAEAARPEGRISVLGGVSPPVWKCKPSAGNHRAGLSSSADRYRAWMRCII